MDLPEDFGARYINKGGDCFPKRRSEREFVVETLRAAHEMLLTAGFQTGVAKILKTYEDLPNTLKKKLNSGKMISALTKDEAKVFTTLNENLGRLFDDQFDFATGLILDNGSGAFSADRNPVTLASKANEVYRHYGIPVEMLVTFARSLAEET